MLGLVTMDAPLSFGPRLLLALSAVWVTGALPGCTRYVEIAPQGEPYYRTGFPLQEGAPSLDEIQESVKRIRVTTRYEVYTFAEEDAPTASESLTDAVLARAVDTTTVSEDRAATAVLLSESDRNLLLLTADHAVHRADTLIQRFPSGGRPGEGPDRIRSISVKRHQTNWILNLPGMDVFRILARDEAADLALIGLEFPEDEDRDLVSPLAVGAGDPERLSWGSFVYVFGYPSGYPIVTRGIVSDPGASVTESFLIDGLWNPGMSGGPILAVRGDGGGLEWVGMARAASVRSEHRLAPDEGAVADDLRVPYEGPIYLEMVRRIEYGITLSVALPAIRDFIDRHRGELRAEGFDPPDL